MVLIQSVRFASLAVRVTRKRPPMHCSMAGLVT
ncbi:Uncharacterised protein [Vibrio cholerae]|nr:Uncharacterised protein [Vibrio cholerae]